MFPKISIGVRYLITYLITVTGLCGLVYITVQQSLRIGANDPQIQIAEDGARAMSNGDDTSSIISKNVIDISESLAPFVLVLDSNGIVLQSSATIQGKLPSIPAGVLAYTKANGEDRVTWQPEDGVRAAIVVVHFSGAKEGYVVSGKSLREIEVREGALSTQVLIVWSIMILIGFLLLSHKGFHKHDDQHRRENDKA